MIRIIQNGDFDIEFIADKEEQLLNHRVQLKCKMFCSVGRNIDNARQRKTIADDGTMKKPVTVTG